VDFRGQFCIFVSGGPLERAARVRIDTNQVTTRITVATTHAQTPSGRPAARSIPLSRPFVDETTLDGVKQALAAGKLSGDGAVCRAVERRLASLVDARHVLLTTSCTHALEMAMMLLDLEPGDEVITPSFTFVSGANAVLRGGGVPVFCEITESTHTMDPVDVERRITKRTKAIAPVHYAGVAADLDPLLELARRHKIPVIEDAAQGVNARYKGRSLGTIGDMGAYSFHDTKNYVSGEGGAFLTNVESTARRAEIIREKGTNRENFLRGEVDKYTWVDEGSSYILSEILAAVLQTQLAAMDEIQSLRARLYRRYVEGLKDLAGKERLRLPVVPAYAESNYHIFHILLPSEQERDRVMRALKERGIGAAFHYVPLHSSPYAIERLGTAGLRLPVTDAVAGRLLRLPLHPRLSDEDQAYVLDALHDVLS
jgi:dTDP-4-amino-4,6-dideoxygalactose transaminase